jgi:hypothetical protein
VGWSGEARGTRGGRCPRRRVRRWPLPLAGPRGPFFFRGVPSEISGWIERAGSARPGPAKFKKGAAVLGKYGLETAHMRYRRRRRQAIDGRAVFGWPVCLAPSGGQTPPRLNLAFDSRWVPPVGGAPSTGTPAPEVQSTDGVHAQCLSDSGAGDRSLVVPRAAARRSQVVLRSKQLGSQTRRCRAEQATGQVARRGDAEAAEEMRGPASGRAQEGRRSPERGQRTSEVEAAPYGYFLGTLFY